MSWLRNVEWGGRDGAVAITVAITVPMSSNDAVLVEPTRSRL